MNTKRTLLWERTGELDQQQFWCDVSNETREKMTLALDKGLDYASIVPGTTKLQFQ